ncbi:MAG: hypothetical protein KDA21_11390, partial [Phycisphaerales bacterium]|nr:hypothetical protein [Phycisphaerales bacterium]
MKHPLLPLTTLVLLGLLAGCGVKVQPLMPTPVLFTDAGFDPLAHVPQEEHWNARRVYFATTRAR